MKRFFLQFKKAVWLAIAHDVMNTAKSAAYSGMLAFFPAMMVVTTLLAQVPEGNTLVDEIRFTFEQLLPADSMELLQSHILSAPLHSNQVLLSAAGFSAFAGLGLMLSMMEGFRRAYRLPREDWGFWERRFRALILVPITLIPLSLATLIVVFGRQFEQWLIVRAGHELMHIVLWTWRVVRWSVSVVTCVTVLGALYHFGTRRKEHWFLVIPGAITSTAIWFPVTLAFGWYVTHVAVYSLFFGSFGAGIALLVWLYLTSFSALFGAELNGVLFRERQELLDMDEEAPFDPFQESPDAPSSRRIL
jgi:membrane protein